MEFRQDFASLVEHFSLSVGDKVVDCSCLHGQTKCEGDYEMCYFRDNPWEREAHFRYLSICEELARTKGQEVRPDVLNNKGKKESIPQTRRKRDVARHRKNGNDNRTFSKKRL